MAATKEIKRRIKSVKNTKKITKAMELVAASKMKRAVSGAVSSRDYARYSWDVLSAIKHEATSARHPLFLDPKPTASKKTLLLLITSNRGLCGAYNSQVLRQAIKFLKSYDGEVDVVVVGKKGENAMRRLNQNIIASFTDLPEQVTSRDAIPIAQILIDGFLSKKYEKVLGLYTVFVSALMQKPTTKQLLPVSDSSLREFIEEIGDEKTGKDVLKKDDNKSRQLYLLEGDVEELAGSLAKKIIAMQAFQMLLESKASEQSARMLAMKNASEASGEMINELTLVFNKARQASITQEISEISAGMASVS